MANDFNEMQMFSRLEFEIHPTEHNQDEVLERNPFSSGEDNILFNEEDKIK